MNPEAYARTVPVETETRDSGLQFHPPRRAFVTRVVSLLGLVGLLLCMAKGAILVYLLLTDSFVAPLILSKDSDLAVQSMLSLSRLMAERHTMTVRMGADLAAVDASEQAISRLEEVKVNTATALQWSLAMTKRQADVGARDLEALDEQHQVIAQMISEQGAVVREHQTNLASGLIHKSDLAREEMVLKQLRIAELSNSRDRLASETQREAAVLTRLSLEQPRNKAVPSTPEALQHQDQLVKLDLELLKLRAEVRAKRLQRAGDEEQLAKLDQLVADMKNRPIFRALESRQNVAFVPYTQLDGVNVGAGVHHCKLWGLFFCEETGHVTELVLGEVLAEDPWGTPMRGQYAILELNEPRAAQSKSLRVRRRHPPGAALSRLGY